MLRHHYAIFLLESQTFLKQGKNSARAEWYLFSVESQVERRKNSLQQALTIDGYL